MSIHITQIGKHKFICGLFWQSLSRPRELLKEAAELAKKIDCDLMILRKDHATAQAGFAQTTDGARRATYSLGAAVSKHIVLEGATYDGQKQPAHNWLGAFKLPDGMWAYFAVRDANFLPNGDFAGTKEQVLERLNGDYGLGGWNVVIGDPELEEFDFHNFNAKTIEDLLPHRPNGQIRAHRWWGLQSVTVKLKWQPIAAICCVSVLLAAGCFQYWQQYQHKMEEQQRELYMKSLRDKNSGMVVPHPWRSMVLPQAFTQACLDKFAHLTPGGWQLDDYVCNGTSAHYSWSRQDSTVEYLLAQVPDAIVDLGGNTATLSMPISMTSGSDEALLTRKNLLEPLVSRLQLMQVFVKFANAPSPKPAPQKNGLLGDASKDAPKPEWETFTFSLGIKGLPPTEVSAVLSQPGIRLNKVRYHNGEWSFEGVIYAKLF